jgi:hypothetical protein
MTGVVRIPEDGHPGQLGNRRLEKLQALAHYLVANAGGKSRDISGEPRETAREPAAERIADHDDRNRLGRSAGCDGILVGRHHDEVDLPLDELGREVR